MNFDYQLPVFIQLLLWGPFFCLHPVLHETQCFMFAKWYNAVRRHIRPPCQRTSRGRIKQLRTTRQAAALVKLSMTGFMKVLLA